MSEDIRKANLEVPQVETSITEAETKLAEGLGLAPDTESELQCVIDQFGEYNASVQEWSAWFYPAQATLEECQGAWMNRACLEEIDEKLQVIYFKACCVEKTLSNCYRTLKKQPIG